MGKNESSIASSPGEVVTDADLERAANAIAVVAEPTQKTDVMPLAPDLPPPDAEEVGAILPVVETSQVAKEVKPPAEAIKEELNAVEGTSAADNA